MRVSFSTFDRFEYPLVVQPCASAAALAEGIKWIRENRDDLVCRLYRHGAVLFRGFAVGGPDDMVKVIDQFGGEYMDYVGGAVPRRRITHSVFNSTELTRLFKLRVHNEMAYQRDHPDFIFFYCDLPARAGGETILADMRKVYQDLRPDIVSRFMQRQIKHVRVFQTRRPLREFVKKVSPVHFHLTWEQVFRTTDVSEVEMHCRNLGLDYEWRMNGDLVVSNVMPPTRRHPATGETAWFNHAMLMHFNPIALGRVAYWSKKLIYPSEADVPYQAYYGDGSPIPIEDMAHAYEVTDRHVAAFPWRRGDLLMVDNRLVAHGRNPYRGKRRIMVAMTRMHSTTSRPGVGKQPGEARQLEQVA